MFLPLLEVCRVLILGTMTAVIAVASFMWMVVWIWLGDQLIGRFVLVALAWCLLSLLVAIACGRFIAAARGPEPSTDAVAGAVELLLRKVA